MLTTKDINLKENKPKKLRILNTNAIEPKQFTSNKKSSNKKHPTITTANLEEYQKKLKDEQRMAKARAARKNKSEKK
ncbi:MAG: hypothetical protein ACOC5G_04500 [Acidobacteriota bacterium]